MKRILYICKEETLPYDGASIFDRRVINILELNYSVDIYRISPRSSKVPPMWITKVNKPKVEELLKLRANTFCIISHESLGSLAKLLKPDVFIFHNIFSEFFFTKHFWLQKYYRLMSKNYEKQIILNSKKVCVLSFREKKALEIRTLNTKIVHFTPGENPNIKLENNINSKAIRRTGTNGWLPKRLSELSTKELNQLKALGYDIVSDKYTSRCITLIEDKFLSGFKLKVIEAIQRGDYIMSFADIEDELKVIDEKLLNNYYFVKGFSHLLKLLTQRHTLDSWLSTPLVPTKLITWSEITEAIIE